MRRGAFLPTRSHGSSRCRGSLDLGDRLQQLIAHRHTDPHSVGILHETSFVKNGRKTACVQRTMTLVTGIG